MYRHMTISWHFSAIYMYMWEYYCPMRAFVHVSSMLSMLTFFIIPVACLFYEELLDFLVSEAAGLAFRVLCIYMYIVHTCIYT